MIGQTVFYIVDKKGYITDIGGEWDDFVEQNEGKHNVTKEETIGKNLFDIIKGDAVKHIYLSMHIVLEKNPSKQITFDYRCDGPLLKRYMKMNIRMLDGNFLYKSTVLDEILLQIPIIIDYNLVSSERVALCSYCKDYRYPLDSDIWKPIDMIYEGTPEQFSITHGVCPKCLERLEQEYKEIIKSNTDT
jgi:hypothetical protein